VLEQSEAHLNNLISKIKSISQKVIQFINESKSSGWQQQGNDGIALAAQVPEGAKRKISAKRLELDDLDFIYFILYQTCLEQEVFDRNDKDELVFKSDEQKKLYKYLLDLVHQSE